MPARHASAAESEELELPLRAMVYQSHRIIYEIDEAAETVTILRVYHSARAPLQPEDLAQ